MVQPIIRSNGTAIYPKSAVLPKVMPIKEKYEGSIAVLEQFNNKSEVNETNWVDELAPDRPFNETLDAINKDGRLDLALETYAQMIYGKGFRVVCEDDDIQEFIEEKLSAMNFDEKLEDGLPSYLGGGNWFIEPEPHFYSDFVELSLPTMMSVTRNAKGHIKRYVQHVNDKDITYKPEEIIHFKLTNMAREPFARGLFHSILSDYTDPRTGMIYDSPLIQMKEIEDNMVEIFKGHANPTVMFHFEDAGEQFIKNQASALKNAKKGSKIVTDKAFDVKVIETGSAGKFDSYIEHMQRDILEPGSKFPLQFFNAGFTARAASESTDSVLIRKVKTIQNRFANQLKTLFIMPMLAKNGKNVKIQKVQCFFETPTKQDATIQDVITAFRDNIIRRPEARKWFVENTTMSKFIDQTDMEAEPPITSVTPTGQMRDSPSGQFGGNVGNDKEVTPKPIPQRKK